MDVLKEMGVGGKAWKLIYQCISMVSYKVLMNGELSDQFCHKVELDKGIPFSPFLFVIAMEKLSQIMRVLLMPSIRKRSGFVEGGFPCPFLSLSTI